MSMPNKYTYVGDIDIELTDHDVQAICHHGLNDLATAKVVAKTYVLSQLKRFDQNKRISTAVEYGCNDYGANPVSIFDADHYLIWYAAWNIHDGQCFDVDVA